MPRTDLHLKSQTELVADCQAYLNDTGVTLATAPQYKEAVNYAVRMWGKRVIIPNRYSITFAAGTYDYTLPRYIKPPFVLKILTSTVGLYYGSPIAASSDMSYQTITNYTVDSDGNDGFTLRLGSIPYAQTGYILYFSENSVMPTGAATVSTTITSSDTSVIIAISSVPEINDNVLLKIDNEWMLANGIARGSTTFTLSNLVRSYWETSATSHTSTTTVTFGVGVDTPALWNQLYNQVGAYIHQLNVQKSTGEDSTRHQQLMSYHQGLADNWWRTSGYVSPRKPKLVLQSSALGPLLW